MDDTALAKEIESRGDLNPRLAKPKPVQAPIVDGDPERKVSVRCVTDLMPWANGKPLPFWTAHEITYGEAVLLESRKMAVILETPKKGD